MKTRVLFLCTHNSCRSQMAEGWLRKLGGEGFDAFSAGTEPTTVHPLAQKVMAEANVDISTQRAKSIDEFADQHFDYVITLCGGAQKTCPVFPGEYQSLHWDIPDPAEAGGSDEERMNAFRSARDDLRARVQNLVPESSGRSSGH